MPQDDTWWKSDPVAAPAGGSLTPLPSPPKEAPIPAPATPEERERLRLSQDKEARDRKEWEATHNADGTPRADIGKPTEFQSKSASFYGRMLRAERAFNAVPEGSRDARTVPGQWLHDTAPNIDNSLNTSDRQNADAAALDFVRASLRQESGASINADEELKQYRIFFPMPGDGPEVLKQKAEARRVAIEGFRIAAGPEASPIEGVVNGGQNTATGTENDKKSPLIIGSSDGGNQPPALPVFAPDAPKMEAVTGDTRRAENPEMSARIDRMVRAGSPLPEINKVLSDSGLSLIKESEYAQVRDFLKQHPDYQGSVARAWKLEPLSGFEKAVTSIGNNPIGAYAINAGQFLTGNTLDNLASDPERARAAIEAITAQNPTASALGGVSGGIMGSLAGEAGLARLGMGSGLARGTLADMAMGAANGAGAADDGSRVSGGVTGALTAGAGSLAGAGVMKGAGRMVAPSGGELSGLYASGVRPTIGQRMANVNDGRGFTGMVGKAVNATEEALQSVPVVGSAIRGARQEARDQFQVGAFNEALKEVGEELPKGMRPGTDPHAYAQTVFNRAYDTARTGMTAVPDEQFAGELAALAPDISTLGESAQGKLRAILKNTVNSKLVDGVIIGKNYKAAVSDLGKHIARLRKGATSDDQGMADVLEGVQSALDGAARRHSDADAVKLLDAADAGYAKFVRIEDAARRRGGDAGTFSPAQFDSSVQNASGGVRSKSYLRGDALMQDYAKAGRSLEDRMPNSGTPERLAVGTAAAGGVSYIAPGALAVLGAIGAAYAPGVRKVVKGAMAPRGAKAQAIRQQLEKISRFSARVGAASGVVALPGTSPGQ